jgi:hypothetical protein
MRCVLIAGLGLIGMSGAATAQGARYPVPGAQAPRAHVAPGQPVGGRWGSKIDGRWWAGANAPGGYAAYRRPVRGAAVPTYWNAPRFYVTDWRSYGLLQPPVGYNWVRYYDDAVLLDARGSIHDTEFGVDWDRFDRGPSYAGDQIDTGTAYRSDGYASDGYGRLDRGLGGAAIGAVAGGALGATVAGRGDRLGGALIGAGVGGIAGYAVDKAEDRGRYAQPTRYGAPYGEPAYAYPPEPYDGHGRSTSYTTTVPAGGSHVVHTGPGITTITVQTQPVTTTTTTTTEYVDDAVTYSRPARRVYRSKLRRR